SCSSVVSIRRQPPRSPLFPYTTLFRSHEDQHADDDDERDRRQEHAASRARRRAAASAASTASSVSAPVGPVASSTRAIVEAIRPKGIAPSRNSATAISLAALKTVGAVPPAVAAVRPRR